MSRRTLAVIAALTMVFSVLGAAPAGAVNTDGSIFQQETATIVYDHPFKGLDDGLFFVQLDGAPVATYGGGIDGLAATAPSATGAKQLNTGSAAALAYRGHLELQHAKMLDRVSNTLGRTAAPTYEYFNAANGFAIEMSAEEAGRLLRTPGVANVIPSVERFLQTDAGPAWIGAPSIWDATAVDVGTKGEGVIVGVIDSGINPDNPSFAEVGPVDGYVHTNPLGDGVFVGTCDPTDPSYDDTFDCNNKLIGNWALVPGVGPFDTDGHGSHTASTAAGNEVVASVVGPTLTVTPTISGVAPHANIIAYQVCPAQTCETAAILAAIDQAIVDAVHVINYSIGSPSPDNPWAALDDLGFLAARAAGIFVAHSAGNEGPGAATVGSPMAPWMTHVAATTHNRAYLNGLTGMTSDGDPLADIGGLGFTSGIGPLPIVYAGDYASGLTDTPELCGVGTLGDFVSPWPAGTFTGQIVVCDRGTFGRVEKGANVLAAGAAGYVLADNGAGLVGDAHELPGVHISQSDGAALKAWLATGTGHVAEIIGATEDVSASNADVMAGFSSRGPNRSAPDILAPTVGAPGVGIIAADGADGAVSWGFLSGTSMASPHVAGAAALMKALYPSWTPAEIEAALATTAFTGVLKEDGVTPTDAFDRGSGRIDLAAASNAGLVLNETEANYEAANPAEGGDPKTLNLPSMTNDACVVSCSWTRTVKGTRDADWTVSVVDGAGGTAISVSPTSFELLAGDTQELTITADVTAAASGVYDFGYVILTPAPIVGTTATSPTGAIPMAKLPVVVQPTTGDLPAAIEMATRRNAGSWLVQGLTALEITDFTVGVSGLVKGDMATYSVDQDSDNSSPYDDPTDGAVTTLVDVPAGATHLIAEVLASESPDLDLFVGLDANADGIPQESEEVCVSASGTALEKCVVEDPAAGSWWVHVQNWASSAEAPDDFDLSTAVLTGDDERNMTVEGPDTQDELEPFDIRVFWDLPYAMAGDRYYGALSFGTDAANAGNLGSIPVTLDRLGDDVSKSGPSGLVLPGDRITYEITIQPNVTNEDITYAIEDVLPDGVTYVPGSATNGAVVKDGVLTWFGKVLSPALAEQDYVMTNSLTDPMCDTGFGGYVNLENFGIFADPSITGDTTAFSAFTGQNPFQFYGGSYTGAGFTDDGFAIFDAGSNYGGSPWVPQAIPNADQPNALAAALWSDFEIFYDAGLNHGVTLATAGPEYSIIEYDDLQLWGGSDPIGDVEIFLQSSVDDTPGFYEIVFAYDNLNLGSVGAATIGVEDALGAEAVSFLNQGDASAVLSDGFQICFNWEGPSFDPVTISYDVIVGKTFLGALSNSVEHRTFTPGSLPVVTDAADVVVSPTPKQLLRTTRNDLSALFKNPPAGTSDEELAAVRVARGNLRRLLASDAAWVTRQRLDAVDGMLVQSNMRKAVEALETIGVGTPAYSAANAAIWDIVSAADTLAARAIDKAIDDGAPSGNVDEAQLRYDLGMQSADAGNAVVALRRYRLAWKWATAHLLP